MNGDKRPVSGPYACVKGRKCDGISAREDEQTVACLSTKVVPQGDFHALSFEQEDRAVFMESVQSSKFKVLSLNAPPEVIP